MKILLLGPEGIRDALRMLYPAAEIEMCGAPAEASSLNPYASYDLLVFSPAEEQRTLLSQKMIADLFTYVVRGGTMLALSDGLFCADHPELSHLFGGRPIEKLPWGELTIAGDFGREICSALTLMDFAPFGERENALCAAYGNASYAFLWTQGFCKGKTICFAGDARPDLLADLAEAFHSCIDGRTAS